MTEDRTSLEEAAESLAQGIEDAVPGWVERSVERVATAFFGSVGEELRAAAVAAGRSAKAHVGPDVRSLLLSDIDRHSTTPLSVLRSAVRYPADVLREAGVPPVVRDDFAESRFPDDDYDLSPASLSELDPGLSDLGMAWGAAKAMAHKRRHGTPGPGGRARS